MSLVQPILEVHFSRPTSDDAILSRDLPTFIKCLDQLPEEIKLIQIESKEKQKQLMFPVSQEVNVLDRKLIVLARCTHSTAGYLIHRDAAKLALETFKCFYQPIDLSIFSIWSPLFKIIKPWQAIPGLVQQDDNNFSSDIWGKRSKPKVTIFERYHIKRLLKEIKLKRALKTAIPIHIPFK